MLILYRRVTAASDRQKISEDGVFNQGIMEPLQKKSGEEPGRGIVKAD
jgi:hypothetical protein